MSYLFFISHVRVALVSRFAGNPGFPDAGHDDQNIVEIDKSNVLLMGPTGSGSYFLKTILHTFHALRMPCTFITRVTISWS
jgi:ATP-dependent protease Clp ATPase subunit